MQSKEPAGAGSFLLAECERAFVMDGVRELESFSRVSVLYVHLRISIELIHRILRLCMRKSFKLKLF